MPTMPVEVSTAIAFVTSVLVASAFKEGEKRDRQMVRRRHVTGKLHPPGFLLGCSTQKEPAQLAGPDEAHAVNPVRRQSDKPV